VRGGKKSGQAVKGEELGEDLSIDGLNWEGGRQNGETTTIGPNRHGKDEDSEPLLTKRREGGKARKEGR